MADGVLTSMGRLMVGGALSEGSNGSVISDKEPGCAGGPLRSVDIELVQQALWYDEFRGLSGSWIRSWMESRSASW